MERWRDDGIIFQCFHFCILVRNVVPFDVINNILLAWASCVEEDDFIERNFVGIAIQNKIVSSDKYFVFCLFCFEDIFSDTARDIFYE